MVALGGDTDHCDDKGESRISRTETDENSRAMDSESNG